MLVEKLRLSGDQLTLSTPTHPSTIYTLTNPSTTHTPIHSTTLHTQNSYPVTKYPHPNPPIHTSCSDSFNHSPHFSPTTTLHTTPSSHPISSHPSYHPPSTGLPFTLLPNHLFLIQALHTHSNQCGYSLHSHSHTPPKLSPPYPNSPALRAKCCHKTLVTGFIVRR